MQDNKGYIILNRKKIPFYLENEKAILISSNFSSIRFGNMIEEKKLIKGITTGNRNLIFLNNRYSATTLAYQVMIVSASNTGMYDDISKFDRICFEGTPINVFAGPGKAFEVQESDDISKRMATIQPKEWSKINKNENVKIGNRGLKLSIDYWMEYNLNTVETSLGKAVPRFCIEYDKTVTVKCIPKTYLMVYDFFCFLNFCRNLEFSKIYIQRKVDGKFDTIATVNIKSEHLGEYDGSEKNSIVFDECKECWGELFKTIALRRKQKIYDNFYIPLNNQKRDKMDYKKFLSCALSFESEYSRIYPSKKEENEKFAKMQTIVRKSADELDVLFELARADKITKEEFERCFYGRINHKLKKLYSRLPKRQGRKYEHYYQNIIRTLSYMDFSLEEKYKKALLLHKKEIQPIIDRLCACNGISFPNENDAGSIFAKFRNSIAHGTPESTETIHCVLYEIANALIYTMILEKANMKDDKIGIIIKKMF